MSSSPKRPSLNNLVIDGPVWLASDIHLGPNNPRTAESFYGFLDRAGAQSGALFLLGDIFDVWVGDDCIDQPEPWLEAALTNLKHVAARIPLWIAHGNRDFLMGQRLATHIGAQLLDSQTVLQVSNKQVLLAHGDEFCSDDKEYQRFRKIVRNSWVQRAFLCLSLKQREAIARKARLKSMQTQASPSAVWHDVSPSAIASKLAAHQLQTLIHGHTHRPGHFPESVGDQLVDRWVLPDWESDHLEPNQPPRGGWLVVDESGLSLYDLHARKIK